MLGIELWMPHKHLDASQRMQSLVATCVTHAIQHITTSSRQKQPLRYMSCHAVGLLWSLITKLVSFSCFELWPNGHRFGLLPQEALGRVVKVQP